METKFAEFLRSGGDATCHIERSPPGARRWTLKLKQSVPGYAELRQGFERNLNIAESVVADRILSATNRAFSQPLDPSDLADTNGDRAAALEAWDAAIEVLWAEWSARPDRFQTLRRSMELRIIRAFSGVINERQQRALGIEHYRWVTAGDDKVRPGHASNQGKVFTWDEGDDGEHPGQAPNCRCIALPVIPDSPDWTPDVGFGSGYENRRAAAEFQGLRDAVAGLGTGAARALRELPGNIAWLRRLARLRDREAAGTLTEAEAAELAEMIATRDGIVADWEAEVRRGPEGWAGDAAALLDYAVALRRRPILLDEAHRQGLATEAQVLEAHRERAYFETLVLAGFAGGALLSRMMLRRRGRDDLDEDTFLADETARLTRAPADPDWPVIENPGIVWGGPIREQGGPFEADLASSGSFGDWLETSSRNYPTFDFYSPDTGIATSAKTLDTNAINYVDRPTRIFSRLTGVVDRMSAFENGGRRQYRLNYGMISEMRLVLAVPQDTSRDQIVQLQRAIEYARDNGVVMEVTFVR